MSKGPTSTPRDGSRKEVFREHAQRDQGCAVRSYHKGEEESHVRGLGPADRRPLSARLLEYELEVVVVIALLALLLGLGCTAAFVYLQIPPTYEGRDYDLFATQIVDAEGCQAELGLTAHKPPVDPFFLAGLYALLGKRWFGPIVGILATLGGSTFPLLVYVGRILYPETASTLLFFLLLFLALRLPTSDPRSTKWRSPVQCGALPGLTARSRPNVSVLLPALGIRPLLHIGWRPRARIVAVVLLSANLAVLPWIVRNYPVFSQLVIVSTEGGIAPWQVNNAHSAGGRTLAGRSVWSRPDYPASDSYGDSELSGPESSSKLLAKSLRWIREPLADFVSLIRRKVMQTGSLITFTTQSDRTAHHLTRLILLPHLLFLALGAFGPFAVLGKWRLAFPLFAIPLLTSVQAATFFGGTRYVISMRPSWVPFAAAGAEKLASRFVPLSSLRNADLG